MMVAQSDASGKLFQTQIESLKILKGAGLDNPAPCRKLNGFLSLETANQMTYVIFRTLTGKQLFKGIVGQKAKVKVLTEADDPKFARQFKAKFSALVTAVKEDGREGTSKYAVEHCQAKFLNSDVLDNFVKVFQSSSAKEE